MKFRLFNSTPGHIFLIAALTFAAYSFMVTGTFKSMDDNFSIVNNPQITSFVHAKALLTQSFFGGNSYYRPLISLSFMTEYHFFKLNPYYYYLNNILIHVLTSLSLLAVMRIILRRETAAKTTSSTAAKATSSTVAFAVALLFALHPVQWEAVANIPGRAILLCSLFSMITFLCYLKARENNSWPFYALSLLAYPLAIMSKESANMLPVVMVSYEYFLGGRPSAQTRERFFAIAPYFLIVGCFLIIRKALGITHFFYWNNIAEAFLGLLTFLRSVITDLRIFVWPMDMHFDRGRALFTHFINGEVFLTVAFFIALAALIWSQRRRLPAEVLFFISWFVIELVPVSQFLVTIGLQPGYISTAEHFLYVASVGVFALMAMGAEAMFRYNQAHRWVSSTIFKSLVAGCYVFFFLITVKNNIYASSEEAMYLRTLHFNPENARIKYNLGHVYARQGRFQDAETVFRELLKIAPEVVHPRIALGKALCDQGRYWEGIAEYEKVHNPGKLKSLLARNLELTYNLLASKYQQRLKNDPDNPQLHYSLGVVYAKSGKYSEAVEHYLRTLAKSPDDKAALYNLAVCYEHLTRPQDAIEYYRRVVNLDGPDDELARQAFNRLSALGQQMTASPNSSDQN